MKKPFVLLCALLLVLGVAPAVFAIPVTVTYTADNVVGAWYQDGSAPAALGLGPNANDWTKSDTGLLDLLPGTEYQLVWQVRNWEYPATPTTPAGFLAQIDLGTSLIVSSSAWQVSHTPGNLNNFNATGWDWHVATEYGTNDPTDPNIWGSVAGISYAAKWIWDGANYGDANTPFYQEIYVRATFETAPVPEPATMLLLGSGLIGLVGLGKKKLRRKS